LRLYTETLPKILRLYTERWFHFKFKIVLYKKVQVCNLIQPQVNMVRVNWT
jgi:hypothetical protein